MIGNVRSKASTTEIDLGLKAYMNKVYSFMAVGLALTGVIAHLTSKWHSISQPTQ